MAENLGEFSKPGTDLKSAGQIVHVGDVLKTSLKPGTDLESAGHDVFKTPPTSPIWPSFGWDIWG